MENLWHAFVILRQPEVLPCVFWDVCTVLAVVTQPRCLNNTTTLPKQNNPTESKHQTYRFKRDLCTQRIYT